MGRCPRHLSRGPPTPLLQTLLYLLRDRTGRICFEKAKAHGTDNMNNLADKLANEGRLKGRVLNIGSLLIPKGWVDTAPILCHQPLDYLTKLVIRKQVYTPAKTVRFESFSDKWVVSIGHMFGVVLDPGNHIGKVWALTIPEGMKEVLWKEMNGALVLGHKYFGRGHAKSDMGRHCRCGTEMSLGHILVGCGSYDLRSLMEALLAALGAVCPLASFKTLSPDSWGTSPWYPILALKEIEETAYPIVKGRRKVLKLLRRTRQRREWLVGNFYWAIWKWRMKEIHDERFTFLPEHCVPTMSALLATPTPPTLLTQPLGEEEIAPATPSTSELRPPALTGDLTKLPPPVSHCVAGGAGRQPPTRGIPALRAIRTRGAGGSSNGASRRDAILRALTDDTYA